MVLVPLDSSASPRAERLRRTARVAGIGALAALAASALPALASSPPVRRALLIGINEYATDAFPDLRGAVNDVETTERILTSRFGFAPADVTVLTDAEATRDRILAALAELADIAAPGDFVYIHYSGHGSQVADQNGDETDDGMDETLLPHDGRTDGVPDITDDEIGEILWRMRARKAVLVLDSCHSGTATRGAGPVTRAVPPDTRTELYRDPAAGATKAVVRLDTPERWVLLTGAAAHQNAVDGPLDGRFHGFFSYALTRALEGVGAGATPRDLHEEVGRTLERLSAKLGGMTLPEPQFEAPSDLLDAPLFPAGQAAPAMREPSPLAAWLLALANPSTDLDVSVHAVGAGAAGTMRIRKLGEPRKETNSLMLEIRTSADAYVTVVDVDTEGNVHVLFPGPERTGFLPDGLVRGDEIVRLPDSLEPGGRAGFFWDYGPPAGIDTVLVFASRDLATARAFRARLATEPASIAPRGIGGLATGERDAPQEPAWNPSPDWAVVSLPIRVTE